MKWYYRFFVVAILAAALIGPYFIKKPDGKPVMEMPTAKDFIPDALFSRNSDSNTSSPSASAGQSYYTITTSLGSNRTHNPVTSNLQTYYSYAKSTK